MGSPRGAQNHFFSTLSAFEFQNFLAPALTRQGEMGSGFASASQRWRAGEIKPPSYFQGGFTALLSLRADLRPSDVSASCLVAASKGGSLKNTCLTV